MTVATPDLAELIARAERLRPAFAARAAECEALGRVPDASMRELFDAGLFKILQPARYGGYELDPMTHYRVVMALAPSCPSTTWVFSLLGIHQWEVGTMEPRIAADLWGEDNEVLFSSSYAPFGSATKVAGGYRIKGRWPWSSGCDHCQWVIVGAPAEADHGGVELQAFLIKRPHYQIVADSWNYAGMGGTGSKDIIVDDAFVPSYRVHNVQRAIEMHEPGVAEFTAPTYKHPFGVTFAYTLTAVALGVADAALALFIDKLGARVDSFTGSAFKQDAITQQALAEIHADLDGAHLKMERDFREMGAYIAAGQPIPIARRVHYKYNSAWIAHSAREAVNRIVQYTGGATFERGNPMQRYFRDINTMTNHLFINVRKGAVNMGGYLLGGGNQDPLL